MFGFVGAFSYISQASFGGARFDQYTNIKTSVIMHGKITKILRLYSHGMGIKSISATLGLSRNTVRRYIRAYQELGKSINELLRLDEEHLQELLFCGRDIEFTPSLNELELRPMQAVCDVTGS